MIAFSYRMTSIHPIDIHAGLPNLKINSALMQVLHF